MKGFWLWHPDSSGEKVYVVRGWLARMLYPQDFATVRECETYAAFLKGLFHEQY